MPDTCAAFRGDRPALHAARTEIRSHFEQSRDVSNADDIRVLCAEGRDAAQFLQQSVVQGKLNERGNYGVLLPDADA